MSPLFKHISRSDARATYHVDDCDLEWLEPVHSFYNKYHTYCCYYLEYHVREIASMLYHGTVPNRKPRSRTAPAKRAIESFFGSHGIAFSADAAESRRSLSASFRALFLLAANDMTDSLAIPSIMLDKRVSACYMRTMLRVWAEDVGRRLISLHSPKVRYQLTQIPVPFSVRIEQHVKAGFIKLYQAHVDALFAESTILPPLTCLLVWSKERQPIYHSQLVADNIVGAELYDNLIRVRHTRGHCISP